MTRGFMDGYSPEPSAPLWRPGQTTITHEVLCCPHCGSIRVAAKDNGKSDSIIRWECKKCGQSFKRTRGTAMHAYISAIDCGG